VIIKNFLKIVVKKYIYFCHKLNLVYPIYFLWKVSLKQLKINSDKKNKKIIIVFGSTGGDKDINSAYHNNYSKYLFFQINHWYIQESCNFFISGYLDDYNRGLEKAPIHERASYDNFLKALIKYLKDRSSVIGFINFNNSYYAQKDFAKISLLTDCPFVTVHKECFKSPGQLKRTIDVYSYCIGEYQGTQIAVHNEDMKNAILDSGITTKEKVVVTGQARSSLLLSNNINNIVNENSLLYFAISDRAGLLSAFAAKKESKTSWNGYDRIIREHLIKFSANSGVTLYIKEKGIDKVIVYKNNIKEYINIPSQKDLFNLSNVVVGFNTTAILEAVMANKIVISPQIGIHKDDKDYLFDWSECVQIVLDEEDFLNKINSAVKQKKSFLPAAANRSKLIDKYLGNADGQANRRLRNFIESNFNLK
jgi:hypothetical protein